MWTEAWSGWLTELEGTVPYRPAEDLAKKVAKFIQTVGSFIWTAGGPFIATIYDYDTPLDEFCTFNI
ncbi:beta-galactosidase [Artemisia annua]|uniref:Beta-galactosidase n=1 Tax=Artemisia annua TaxID=35608 RepID=A0A2U1NXG8_ARTAN|nr:beta-galactosidase [Artemisia annua]